MSITTLALYGSCARSDNNESSDIDIFAISNDSEYKMIVQSKMNIASYPERIAHERARSGDLFMLHICSEAKPIYDPENGLTKLKNNFKYKESYNLEISLASDLGWFLVDNWNTIKNYTLLNRRIAWCVRTILISKSAQQRAPVFSSTGLTELSGKNYTQKLIENKNSSIRTPSILELLAAFLSEFGCKRPIEHSQKTSDAYIKHFIKTQNAMGTKTASSANSSFDGDDYI